MMQEVVPSRFNFFFFCPTHTPLEQLVFFLSLSCLLVEDFFSLSFAPWSVSPLNTPQKIKQSTVLGVPVLVFLPAKVTAKSLKKYYYYTTSNHKGKLCQLRAGMPTVASDSCSFFREAL